MNFQTRSDKRFTVVDANNLVLKDNNFVVEGMNVSITGFDDEEFTVKVNATITEGVFFMNGVENTFLGVVDEELKHVVGERGFYTLWIGINNNGEVVSYVTEDYESPVYDAVNVLLIWCVRMKIVN